MNLPRLILASASRGSDPMPDRKSTRLNSSHDQISYAVFCLKKKKKVNDNAHPSVVEFQHILADGPDGAVRVNFYDRRLPCCAGRTLAARNVELHLARRTYAE